MCMCVRPHCAHVKYPNGHPSLLAYVLVFVHVICFRVLTVAAAAESIFIYVYACVIEWPIVEDRGTYIEFIVFCTYVVYVHTPYISTHHMLFMHRAD